MDSGHLGDCDFGILVRLGREESGSVVCSIIQQPLLGNYNSHKYFLQAELHFSIAIHADRT
jgi:hypothetical protein